MWEQSVVLLYGPYIRVVCTGLKCCFVLCRASLHFVNSVGLHKRRIGLQGAPTKNNPLGKMLYFSHGSKHLDKLSDYINVSIHITYPANFTEITDIGFFRYSSLNFKVHFLKWTCSCTLNIYEQQIKFSTAFHQQFKCFNHECQMPITHSVFKQCSQRQCQAVAATDDWNS